MDFMHPAERKYGPKPTPDETHFTHAADGWRLAMYRYKPRGVNLSREPILLQHGLGSCAKQFDLGVGSPDAPSPSLAHWLADQGYDVWACDLRGSGGSQRPGPDLPARWDWSVDDFIQQDSPAFVDYILSTTGFKSLHWVGHSLGGILLLCHTALHGSPRIASGIVASAALDYSGAGSSYDYIEPLKHVGRLLKRIPAGAVGKHLSPLFGRWKSPFEASLYYYPNMSPAAARAIPAGANYDISGETLYQLASLFKTGGLKSLDGTVTYSDKQENIYTPIRFMAGEKDLQCRPEIVHRASTTIGGQGHDAMTFGRSHGHSEHYGHFDIFSGLRADQEVFPHVLTWIKSHPAAALEADA